MGKKNTNEPVTQSPKEKAAAERAERLRKQLRENLHRRKEQSRARESDSQENQK